MKIVTLILLLLGAVAVQAQNDPPKQKLKDLLYSGKLKKDSSGVIRSSDDLSSKIDTTTKKAPEPVKPAATAAPNTPGVNNPVTGSVDSVAATTTPATPAAPVKSNQRLLKEYTDSITKLIQAEVYNSKSIKKNIYYILFDYEIGTDGKVTFTNVNSTPASPQLQAQVTLILDGSPLQLAPVLDGAGQPRKVKRKHQLSVTKE